MTYEQIGALLKISHIRVRQIEARALSKLRRGLNKKGVTADEVKAMLSHSQTFEYQLNVHRPVE